MFKSGFVLNNSGPVDLYFETSHSFVELWVDSVSLKPFTPEEWTAHQIASVEKMRKTQVRFRAIDGKGTPLANASLSFLPRGGQFPFGNAVNSKILNLATYQNWFVKRFKYTVFEKEMIWENNELYYGRHNYKLADAMIKFAKVHDIKVRGHYVIGDLQNDTPLWVSPKLPISDNYFRVTTRKREYFVVRRYKGQLIHWNVVNEMLHGWYLEEMLGNNASAVFYKRAHSIDQIAIPFMNDYNTIEDENDELASPLHYLARIQDMVEYGYKGPLGIGLQGHFNKHPNFPYIRTALDILAAAKLPIWISELDVDSHWPQAAEFLEKILRELHSHPAVNGILIWAPWSPPLCGRMCLTDSSFKNLPIGDVVDKMLQEWHLWDLEASTDTDGYFYTYLSYGDYEVKVNHGTVANSPQTHKIKVAPSQNIINIELST